MQIVTIEDRDNKKVVFGSQLKLRDSRWVMIINRTHYSLRASYTHCIYDIHGNRRIINSQKSLNDKIIIMKFMYNYQSIGI